MSQETTQLLKTPDKNQDMILSTDDEVNNSSKTPKKSSVEEDLVYQLVTFMRMQNQKSSDKQLQHYQPESEVSEIPTAFPDFESVQQEIIRTYKKLCIERHNWPQTVMIPSSSSFGTLSFIGSLYYENLTNQEKKKAYQKAKRAKVRLAKKHARLLEKDLLLKPKTTSQFKTLTTFSPNFSTTDVTMINRDNQLNSDSVSSSISPIIPVTPRDPVTSFDQDYCHSKQLCHLVPRISTLDLKLNKASNE